jgi:SAM-dependent methyltransferase
MEEWYQDLATDRDAMTGCFRHDYTPFEPLLATLSGEVLDLGGGIGATRHFLKTDVNYVVVDPSIIWRSQDWTGLAGEYPCLQSEPNFVRGIGEQLPFRDASFDAVLAMWSLNHVEDPAAVVREAARVLRRGATLLLVLEDMEPRVADLLVAATDGARRTWARRLAVTKAACVLQRAAWPLQNDHVRIAERDLQSWCDGSFEGRSRQWLGGYLAMTFARTGTR